MTNDSRAGVSTEAGRPNAPGNSASKLEPVVHALRLLGLDASTLERAEDTGFVELVEASVRFRHPLMRSVVYQMAPYSERRAAHRAAAAAWKRAASLSPDQSARSRRCLEAARATWYAGRPQQALDLLEEALSLAASNLAAIARQDGRIEEAERLFRRALDIKENLLGPHHPDLAPILNNLALLRRLNNDPDGAEALCQRALTILAATVQPTHPTLQAVQQALAMLRRP